MKVTIKATEVSVASHPEGWRDWKLVRLEYNDPHKYCLNMALLWVPPNANPKELEELFSKWQEE